MINKLLSIISLALVVSCSTAQEKDALITGYTLDYPDKTKIKLIDMSSNLTVDSSVIMQNKFRFSNVLGDIEPDHKIIRIGEPDQPKDIVIFSGRENIEIKETVKGIFIEIGSKHNQKKSSSMKSSKYLMKAEVHI